MNKEIILLHLSLIDGIGPRTIKKILYPDSDVCEHSNLLLPIGANGANRVNKHNSFDLQEIYALKKSDFINLFGFSASIANKLYLGLKDIHALEKEAALISKHNIQFVTLLGDNYPKLLKNIYAPPPVLYIKSNNKNILDYNKKIAFVGSRKAHEYGKTAIENIIPPMVQNNWFIVSGGAIGADSMAHRETVNSGGKTIAVIGSGLLNPYPNSNKELFEKIIDSEGALISPFKLSAVARPGNFPARNRVIAGLSLGCVVVQAAKKSGASITAQFALEQGREVFAIPGPIGDELSLGCHMLISQGAKLISCAEDILTEFDFGYKREVSQNLTKINTEKKESNSVSSSEAHAQIKKISKITKNLQNKTKSSNTYENGSIEKIIMDCCAHQSCAIDEIAIATNKDMQELHEILFDMQLNGDIKQNHAGMFERV